MNKEVFDAEIYAIGETLRIALKRGQTGLGRVAQKTITKFTKNHMWADLRAAISRLQHTAPGPG